MSHLPRQATLFASATRTAAVANSRGTAVTDLARIRRAVLVLDVTAMGGAAGDVLDVYVDVSLDGSTWMNAVHFPQIAGNAAAQKHYAVLAATNVAATTFNVSADCAAGVTKPYLFGAQMSGRYTLVNGGAGSQSATFSLMALLQ